MRLIKRNSENILNLLCMINNIPSAEEFLRSETRSGGDNPFEYMTENDLYFYMREFARLHVKAALGAAKSQALKFVQDYTCDSILNSYPETNIK